MSIQMDNEEAGYSALLSRFNVGHDWSPTDKNPNWPQLCEGENVFVSTYQKTEERVTLGINPVAWEQSCYFYWFVIAMVWFAPVLLYAR